MLRVVRPVEEKAILIKTCGILDKKLYSVGSEICPKVVSFSCSI